MNDDPHITVTIAVRCGPFTREEFGEFENRLGQLPEDVQAVAEAERDVRDR